MDFSKFSRLIMIEQTLFALPFVLIGVLFAGEGTLKIWFWVITALAAARTAGMSFNRAIDAEIDSRNPRTKDRPIPKGELRPAVVWTTAIVASVVLIGASFMLNRLCFYLSFPAVFMLFTYSYFKRFSSSSHFYLGFVEAAAPMGGYIAVTGKFTIIPFVLGLIIMAWIAGLDIVYALGDLDFDKKESLHSIPVRMGRKKALAISGICYMFSISAMICAGILTHMELPYCITICFIGIIFFYQQKLARKKNIDLAIKDFFKINMYISPALFFGTLINVLVR